MSGRCTHSSNPALKFRRTVLEPYPRCLFSFPDAAAECACRAAHQIKVIVDVDVVEIPTGALSFGGTYSTNDGSGLVVRFLGKQLFGSVGKT